MQDNQFYDDYQSPLGYRALKNGYDTYGVDHSKFTTREEVEYQYNRVQREKELMQQQRNMGITGNYVQYGTNFWNKSPENNYGFGGSEIKQQTSNNNFSCPYNNNYLKEQERITAIKNNQPINLTIKPNLNANYKMPWYTLDFVGDYYVNKYNNQIDKYAKKYNIDSDLVKAVMYTEAATGHKFGLNQLADLIHYSGSQMPMNIRGNIWGDFNGKQYDTYNSDQNIELGTQILKNIQNSLDNPTPDRIGTLWNNTGANQINSVGAHIKTAYETKPWLE